jgi:hypothetical protein
MARWEGVIMDLFWVGGLVELAGVDLCCYNSFLVNHFTGISSDSFTKIHEFSS